MRDMVSVIMAVYNAEDTLAEAIDSILGQTYTNIQFIICDDASTDGSLDILQQYVQRDNRIILIQNENNSKLSFSLNHCLQYATGKYVARMDADDISTLDRLEKEVVFLESHPEYDLVGTAMQRFNEEGMADVVYTPEMVDKYYIKKAIPFNHATIMTYKYVYDRLEGYTVSERTVRSQDLDLWFRFFAAGFSGHNLQEALYLVREDASAIRRRTFSVRFNALKTRYLGYKLLGFPTGGLIIQGGLTLAKSLVPYPVVEWYRRRQKEKFNKNKSNIS